MKNDVTSQNELELTVSLLNAALESTADGILVVDRQGRIVKYNAKFAAMWRIPPEVLASRDDEQALSTVLGQLRSPEEFLGKVSYLYSHPDEDSYDLLEFSDGRYFERYSQPQRLGDRIVGRVWSFRDVTARIVAERALLDSQRKMEEFVSIASHELRTPLTSLKAQVQLINLLFTENRLHTLSPQKLKRLIEVSDHEISRFSELIEALLDVSRMSSGRIAIRPEKVELTEIAGRAIECMEPQLRAARCEARLTADGPVTGHWDRFRIEQVLINLLSNAAKYGAGEAIDVSVLDEGNEAVIHVRDRGGGIALEDRERIFGRFERGDAGRRQGGLGLGLYIAREIVQEHGGTIRVKSELGKGSDFEVRLPLKPRFA